MPDSEFVLVRRADLERLLLAEGGDWAGLRAALSADQVEDESQPVKDMQGDLDALQACIDAAKALHRQVPQFQSQPVCSNCVTVAGEPAWWPCATVRALDGTPEPQEER